MNELLGLVRSIGVARLTAILGVTIGVAAALAIIIARIGEPPMGVLFADLEPRDAQTVIERLEQSGVKYKMRESGGKIAIIAPTSEVSGLRVELAADGLVHSAGVGYEIFDKDDAFGSTSFQQNINRLRALEGELARTISSIAGVRSARVHLVMPERELFARDKNLATASIVVDAPGGLDQRSVRAIANLAASAVPELSPSRVTVLDAAGNLLASGRSEDEFGAGADERVAATETRIRRMVEDIVGRVVGPDNLRVQVAAELDLARVTENSEIIDPDSQTVLSSVTVDESANSNDPAIGRGVTVANALPGAQTVADGATATSANRRIEETTNYEISRTVRSEVREQGAIKRLSVAVALNAGESGANARTPEDLARIEALVRSAIGYSEARGDNISVVEIAFTPASAAVPAGVESTTTPLSRETSMRLVEVGALALIALALVVFVLRPMLAPSNAQPSIASVASNPPPGARLALAPSPAAISNSAFEQKIDLARVEGQVKASSLNKVADVVKGHTDESAGILKSWIRQAS